jgi:hypothetical protein
MVEAPPYDAAMSRLRMRAGELAFRHAPRVLPLRRIGGYHGTNKAKIVNLGLSYLDIYERYLQGWRGRTFALLELGVYRGESLRMWRTYFPKARVYGLDIDPAAAERLQGEFTVFTGSQSDDTFITHALGEIGPGLKLVVDDASHINELTLASFDLIFPRLPAGALYVIEDLAPETYQAAWPTAPGIEHNVGVSLENRREQFDDFIEELIHDADAMGSGRWGEGRAVSFVHAWPGLLVVGRA